MAFLNAVDIILAVCGMIFQGAVFSYKIEVYGDLYTKIKFNGIGG